MSSRTQAADASGQLMIAFLIRTQAIFEGPECDRRTFVLPGDDGS
jgi:hypothetical protein